MRIRILFPWTLLWLPVATGVVLSQPRPPLVSLTLGADTVRVAAGSEFTIVLNAKIAAGWHINSHTPTEESLIPTRVDASGKAFTLLNVEYPEAESITLGLFENPLSVFHNQCPFTLTFRPGAAQPVGSAEMAITLHYQACNDQLCMPPASVTARLVVTIGAEGAGTRNPPLLPE